MLLAWAAVAAGVIIYFGSRVDLGSDRIDRAAAATAGAGAGAYIGSIVVAPPGRRCWEMKLDNRTGRIWPKGYVACEAVAGLYSEVAQRSASRTARMHAIGDAFRTGN
ncbi:MAG: hypothetical protein P8Y71_25305 [Pseudolabrys sp.]